MFLIIMTPLWFWEEPSYWPDSLSYNTAYWHCGFAYSPLGSFEWRERLPHFREMRGIMKSTDIKTADGSTAT